MLSAAFDTAHRAVVLAWAVFLIIIGSWTVSRAVPPWGEKAQALFSHYVTGWTDSACQSNKVACLSAKYSDLDAVHTRLGTAIGALGNQKGKVERDLESRQRELAGNQALLDEGAKLYAQATRAKTTAIFAGREYTPDALKRQLEVLYQERPALQALVNQVAMMNDVLDRRLNDLMVKKTKVRAARDLLPTQIELVRANAVIGDIDATLRDVTKLADNVNSDIADLKDIGGWLATTAEIIKRKAQADRSGAMSDFDKWLNAPRPEQVAPKAAE
ncbi:MAG: hypothetical protein H6872_09330 [Methylobacteriaceae bacterium]|nr:hypothetical protein [Methylobacteriaceae bacterium]